MSKVSTEGVTQKQLVKPDGSGSFSGAAETFTNGTTGFYQWHSRGLAFPAGYIARG